MGGMKDFHQSITLYALLGNDLIPVSVDATGKIISLIQGVDGAVLRTVAVDGAGNIKAILQGISQVTGTVTVPSGNVDANITNPTVPIAGNVNAIDVNTIKQIQGVDGVTYRTMAVDSVGRMIARIMGFDGTTLRDVLVDSSGAMVTRIFGHDGTVYRAVKVNTAGEMMARMYGSHATAPIAVDANGRMIARIQDAEGHVADVDAAGALKMAMMGWGGTAYNKQPLIWGFSGIHRFRNTVTSGGGALIIDHGTVPANEVWIVNLSVYAQTSGTFRTARLGIVWAGAEGWFEIRATGTIGGMYKIDLHLALIAGEHIRNHWESTASGEIFYAMSRGYKMSLAA